MARSADDITGLLNATENAGDGASADTLWELVYPELRRRAGNLFRGERRDHTLSATSVVNEAFVRLASQGPKEWKDRSHFYATASQIMRHVLVDHARGRRAEKRGGDAVKQTLDEAVFPSVAADDAGYDVAGDALDRLAETHERAALVVALRVFGGLTVPEVAAELQVSERTVKSDWVTARVRLKQLLGP